MNIRKILRIIEPEVTSDGAGVTLKRSIATRSLSDLDPFLLFDHFGSENPDEYIAGFPMHPHRGIETVTYMLNGVIKHEDSSGNNGVLYPGDIQWMTAGSGIMHEEMPQIRDGKMQGFQLWVNLPAANKMMQPRYREFRNDDLPTIKREDGSEIKIIAGEVDGKKGLVADIEANPTYLDVKLSASGIFEHQVVTSDNVFAYVFEGDGSLGATSDNESPIIDGLKLIVFDEGELVRVEAGSEGVRFLLVSGQPLNEPIARYGPFVMNTKEEIQEALKDLQQGTFVKSYG